MPINEKENRRPKKNFVREPKEFEERVVKIKRVSKTVKGGRRMRFSALVIVGDKKGRVGYGLGKANEVPDAIRKAVDAAKKNVIRVPLVGGFKTIPHPITASFGAGEVVLRPAADGTGIIAGGSVRSVLELAGIENILSKSLGSNSPLNAANATLEALKSLTPFSEVAKKRGLTMAELLN